VTNNLPAAEALSESPGISVYLLGGQFFGRSSLLVTPFVDAALSPWHFDCAFLGAEGLTKDGFWNSVEDVVALQRAAAARTRTVYACVDASKLGRRAAAFLCKTSEVHELLTDATSKDMSQLGILMQELAQAL
jgi:DeoR/GlpR family transcriptional regulator of sugar metabolism